MIKNSITTHGDDNTSPKFDTVIDYLANNDYEFEILKYNGDKASCAEDIIRELDLPPNSVVRTVVLQDDKGLLMAILPETHLLDFAGLCCVLERKLEIVDSIELRKHFTGINVKLLSPTPNYYGVQAVVYEGLFSEDFVYFVSGEEGILICMPQKDFFRLHECSWKGRFSESLLTLLSVDGKYDTISNVVDKFTPRRINNRIKETYELPIMPSIGKDILKLRLDPNADAIKLSRIVEKDPSLSAQLISWACSPYYGYPGKITSVEDAIVKVLGYELVMNISLGIAIGNIMKIPHGGELGLKAYWRNALCNAALVELLVEKMKMGNRPSKGIAYLSGLLYNIGFLLLGQLFPPQYFLLNKFLQLNKHIPISILENYTMNVSHIDMGVWLMEGWNMPEEIIVATKEHHNADYEGAHCKYSHLVQVANILLKREGIGLCGDTKIPEKSLSIIKLTEQEVEEVFDSFLAKISALDELIDSLAE